MCYALQGGMRRAGSLRSHDSRLTLCAELDPYAGITTPTTHAAPPSHVLVCQVHTSPLLICPNEFNVLKEGVKLKMPVGSLLECGPAPFCIPVCAVTLSDWLIQVMRRQALGSAGSASISRTYGTSR